MNQSPQPFRRAYWACQLTGWGLYALLYGTFFLSLGRLPWRPVVLVVVAGAALGLGVTHALAQFARRMGWKGLALRSLAPRVALSSVMLAVVHQAGVMSVALGAHLYEVEQASLMNFIGSVIWATSLFALWEGLYFGIAALQRSRSAERREAALVAAANEAQLRALRSQLNPHFLFNALNSLRALIADEPARAQLAVTQLSSLLRYSLGAGEEQVVRLGQELEVIESYLALETLRYEQRLRVQLDISPECFDILVPMLLLQTLVENGIKHGIALCAEGGDLRVEARRVEGVLELDVSNPKASALASPTSTGVGLRNTRERLRLLFGDGASLVLDLSGPQVVTRVRLPCSR